MSTSYKLISVLLLATTGLFGQYSETFSVPNKGYLENFVNDFAGVNWTMTAWANSIPDPFFAGRDATNYFKTTAAGKLEAIDLDVEVCWLSPELTISGGSAAFQLDLSWIGFDPNTDYIDVSYSTNGGSTWVPLANAVSGGNSHTVGYVSEPVGGEGNTGSLTSFGVSGITGPTLQIRVCVDNSASTEVVTLDNVSTTNASVGGPPLTCDLVLDNIDVVPEGCPNSNDGAIYISATTSNGPLTYSITGPVNQSNSTGSFTGLPDGSYNILVRDNSFAAGSCDKTASRTIQPGVDNIKPTASNPTTLNFSCPSEVPAVNPAVVTDEADNCTVLCTTEPWINEFHYDNVGTDVNEFVEIAGPAGLNLSAYALYLYDGSTGQASAPIALSGTIDNEQNGFGALTFAATLQNQKEGIALVKNGSTVIEFLSYEGTVVALNGPANGLTSTDVGVSESDASQAAGESLARVGSGNEGNEFAFVDQTATPGSKNGNQTFLACPENVPVVTFQSEMTTGLGNQSNPKVITRTYRVTDAAGNVKDVTHTINVIDAQAPAITCPTNITVSTATGQCSAVVTYSTPTASDNCGSVTVTRILGSASGSSFPVGTSTILYEAEDAVANTKQCSFTVTVLDQENPFLVCPSNIVKSTDPGECSAVVTYTPPVGTDNCSGTITTLISGLGSGKSFPIGTTTERYEAADGAGNTKECSFSITVNDTEAPVLLTCPGPIEVDNAAGLCGATVSYTEPTFSDNCGLTGLVENGWDPNDFFPVGTTVVQYQGFDAAANLSALCSFTVTVNDTEDPVLECIATYPVELGPGGTINLLEGITQQADYLRGLFFTKFEDNCDVNLNFTGSDHPGNLVFHCDDLGDNYVEFSAKDIHDNIAYCTVNIIVSDPDNECNQPPVARCQNITVAVDENCLATISSSQINNGSSDPEGDALTISLDNTGPFSPGLYTVELTVSDGSLEDKCTAQVTVKDQTDPVITCPANITKTNDPGDCGAVVTYNAPAGVDNCPGAVTTQTDGLGSGAFFPVGTTTEAYQVIDAAGNAKACSFTVTVNDQENPEITCPADQDVQCLADVPGYNTLLVTASDNCGPVSVSYVGDQSMGTSCLQTITRTYQAQDNWGNKKTCDQTIKVEDTTPPVLVVPAHITIGCDESTAPTNTGNASATDNCGGSPGISYTDLVVGQAGANYTLQRTWVAMDACGKSTSKVQNITVEDTTPPVFTFCPSNQGVSTDPGLCTAVVTYSTPTASDNCATPVISLTQGLSSGSAFPLGTTVVKYRAADLNSNAINCTFSVTVTDNEAATAVCQAATIQLDEDGVAILTPADIDGGSFDNCSTVTLSIDIESFDCYELGNHQVTLTAADNKGQSTSCTATVTVAGPDADCDNVADLCDLCPGGDDLIDNNHDGLPDCAYFPGVNDVINDWLCKKGKNKKITVCHIPPDNPSNRHDICISPEEVAEHLAHGDYLGGCGDVSCSSGRGNHYLASASDVSPVEQFRMYPNPASQKVQLDLPAFDDHAITRELVIFNTTGQRVYRERLDASLNGLHEVDISSFRPGIYFVQLLSDGTATVSGKLIVGQ